MDTQENKWIAEKLDSLDNLPEGYQPNLKSKWAIIEEGLNGGTKSKKRIVWWMNAAAALLLLMAGITLWTYLSVNRNNKITSAVKVLPAKKFHPIVLNTKIEPAKLPAHKAIISKKKENKINPLSSLAVTEIPKPAFDKVSVKPIEDTPVKVAHQLPKKIKGPRYVQVDFDAPPSSLKQPVGRNTPAYSIHLSFFGTDNASLNSISYTQNTPSIRIKPNF